MHNTFLEFLLKATSSGFFHLSKHSISKNSKLPTQKERTFLSSADWEQEKINLMSYSSFLSLNTVQGSFISKYYISDKSECKQKELRCG